MHPKQIDKIEALKKLCPDYMEVNPYRDYGRMEQIKNIMCEAGHYKKPSLAGTMTSVEKLVLAAQGKSTLPLNRTNAGRSPKARRSRAKNLTVLGREDADYEGY